MSTRTVQRPPQTTPNTAGSGVFARALSDGHSASRGPQHRGQRSLSPRQRKGSLLLAVLLVGLMGWWGFNGGQEAEANPVRDALCDVLTSGIGVVGAKGPEAQGLNLIASTSEMLAEEFPAGVQFTAWEWYGTAGLNWTSIFEEIDTGEGREPIESNCLPMTELADSIIANTIFTATKGTANLMISIYGWLNNADLLTQLFDPIELLIKGGPTSTGLYQGVFVEFLNLMIVISALWMLWVGLIKKRTRESVQGAIWVLGAATFGVVFLQQPLVFVDAANKVMSTATQIAFTATSGLTVSNANAAGNFCAVEVPDPSGVALTDKDGNQTVQGKTILENTTRVVQCTMYRALVYAPWATGQWGVSGNLEATYTDPTTGDPTGLVVDPAIAPNVEAALKAKFPQMVPDIRVGQVNALAIDQNEGLFDAFENYSKEWPEVRKQAEQSDYAFAWAGRNTGRSAIALVSLVAAGVAGGVIIIFAFYILLLKIGFLMLVLASPLFLTLGIIPGFGRKIGLKWAETILGVVLKQIIAIFMLAILIGLYSVILGNTDTPWLVQIMLILAVGIGTIMYRKQFMNMLNFINLGGGGGLDQGNSQLQRQGKRAGAGAMGGVSGAYGGYSEGVGLGGVIMAGVAGASIASRSGRMGPRALTIGNRAGAANARRRRGREAREEREQEIDAREPRNNDGTDGPNTGGPGPRVEPRTPDPQPEQEETPTDPPLCSICRRPMKKTGRGPNASWVCTQRHDRTPPDTSGSGNSGNGGGGQRTNPNPPTSGEPARVDASTPSMGQPLGSELPVQPAPAVAPSGQAAGGRVMSSQEQQAFDAVMKREAMYRQAGNTQAADRLRRQVEDALDDKDPSEAIDRIWRNPE